MIILNIDVFKSKFKLVVFKLLKYIINIVFGNVGNIGSLFLILYYNLKK